MKFELTNKQPKTTLIKGLSNLMSP